MISKPENVPGRSGKPGRTIYCYGGKFGTSRSRLATKTQQRIKRHGMRPWLSGLPLPQQGGRKK